MPEKLARQKAAEIVRDAGGKIIGRTRLQKVAYLLELAGFGEGFSFSYYHYGPYSEDLSEAIRMADAFGLVDETEEQAAWGGKYSVFKTAQGAEAASDRTAFATVAARINAVELELAATAAYLAAEEHCPDPWGETARRKPEKASHMEGARRAYRALLALKTPQALPAIV